MPAGLGWQPLDVSQGLATLSTTNIQPPALGHTFHTSGAPSRCAPLHPLCASPSPLLPVHHRSYQDVCDVAEPQDGAALGGTFLRHAGGGGHHNAAALGTVASRFGASSRLLMQAGPVPSAKPRLSARRAVVMRAEPTGDKAFSLDSSRQAVRERGY